MAFQTYRILLQEKHGLINYTDTKAFVGFSQKLTCRKIAQHYFAILAGDNVFICRRGWEGAQHTEIAAKSLWRKKITITYACALPSLYIISQCRRQPYENLVQLLAIRILIANGAHSSVSSLFLPHTAVGNGAINKFRSCCQWRN